MTSKSIATALTCAIVAGSAALAAAPAGAEPVAHVRYADLDLGSAAGRQTLARRISSAAAKVCPEQEADRFTIAGCRSVAIDRAHADLVKAGVAGY